MFRLFALTGICLIIHCDAYSQAQTQAQTQTGTAFHNLYAFGRLKGSTVKANVVGIVGFYGRTLPADWRFLIMDPANKGMRHEYIMRNGQEMGQRHFRVNPAQDVPNIPIPREFLKIDSERAFDIANGAASAAGVGFDSMHYQLRCRDLRNEPVWLLTLVNSNSDAVGVVYLSAVDGKILRASWNPKALPNFFSQNNAPMIPPKRGIWGGN